MMIINKTKISENDKTYIIAELSANHEQNFDLAVKTISAMKDSGADAVKLQTYTPDAITIDSDQPWFKTREDSLWAGQKMYDLYKKGETPWEWHSQLQKVAVELGMDFFSSPFDLKSVDLLESINVPAYKIASLEITDIPLIEKCAKTCKPIILSTGIARIEDIDLAIKTCMDVGNENLALLKCTSAYPTPFEEVNLRQIDTLKKKYNLIVGLSDHTLGIEVPIASVALGARIIEKHFILSRKGNGIDRDFSLEPHEFKQMVEAIRNVEKAMGIKEYTVTPRMKLAQKSCRSLFIVADVVKGDVLTSTNMRSIRPGIGLHPKHYKNILGKKVKQDLIRGTPLELKHVCFER
ncbi:N-acetylneuraminate synthase [Desulfocapsa sulfexigens DSM 10523]|uniref:N-acetylneuraminate synthase n=1 Tax=Desulfocapsa sulfexigens (strain DSM 10523 / SB164P1) TaxID=1167006 RepID=M1PH64_DESSD|nr:pseudaminic acid synthase [Desulfocapsa sulfexigens]AGF78960.1 N-acetylneuraminate synthase [Desulfocapsa sulfexigens DSM 10523]